MPRIIRTAVFSRDEIRVFRQAARFVDIAFPLRSDGLVQRSPEALARAVQDDDQRRRAMGALLNQSDPVDYPHVLAARDFLDAVITQMVKAADIDHWLGLSDTPDHPQSQQMAQVLAAERTGQQRIVREAIGIINEALSHMSPSDDPRPRDRRTSHGGFPNPSASL